MISERKRRRERRRKGIRYRFRLWRAARRTTCTCCRRPLRPRAPSAVWRGGWELGWERRRERWRKCGMRGTPSLWLILALKNRPMGIFSAQWRDNCQNSVMTITDHRYAYKPKKYCKTRKMRKFRQKSVLTVRNIGLRTIQKCTG